jgi:hypothetical protein
MVVFTTTSSKGGNAVMVKSGTNQKKRYTLFPAEREEIAVGPAGLMHCKSVNPEGSRPN